MGPEIEEMLQSKYLGPEIVKMLQFLGPESARFLQCLCPETAVMFKFRGPEISIMLGRSYILEICLPLSDLLYNYNLPISFGSFQSWEK